MVLGIDIGGSYIKFGILDAAGTLVTKYQIPTKKDDTDRELLRSIAQVCETLKAQYSFRRIGIGTPGQIDARHGICIRADNLPYRNTPITAILSDALSVPVALGNDATCAVLGELHAGLGTQYRNFILLTLGTGIGGGIVIDGQVYTGRQDSAGEFGHMRLIPDGLPCPCGRKGCFEQYASVTALISQTAAAVKACPDSLLSRKVDNGITGKTVFDARKAGCPVAAQVIDTYTGYLSEGLLDLNMLFAPEVIVLSGGITAQQEYLLQPLREKTALHDQLQISPLGNDAGVIGAAFLAKEAMV